jgi:hypothetical protein
VKAKVCENDLPQGHVSDPTIGGEDKAVGGQENVRNRGKVAGVRHRAWERPVRKSEVLHVSKSFQRCATFVNNGWGWPTGSNAGDGITTRVADMGACL